MVARRKQHSSLRLFPDIAFWVKIIIGQKIVALQRSDVGGNPE